MIIHLISKDDDKHHTPKNEPPYISINLFKRAVDFGVILFLDRIDGADNHCRYDHKPNDMRIWIIREDVEEYEKKLSYISDVIDEWLTCQRDWMYLESIFSAEDIQK